jgi:hypothetical protein
MYLYILVIHTKFVYFIVTQRVVYFIVHVYFIVTQRVAFEFGFYAPKRELGRHIVFALSVRGFVRHTFHVRSVTQKVFF